MTGPAFLGKGLIRPFRRNQRGDFQSAEGQELVMAAVGQILGTRAAVPGSGTTGELPWRTEFGSLLHLLRHAPNNDTVRNDLALNYTRDALRRWEPRIIVREVTAAALPTAAGAQREMLIKVKFNFISTNTPGNQVVFRDDLVAQTTIPI